MVVSGFRNRVEAGEQLSRLLIPYSRQGSLILTPLNESILIGKVIAKRLAMPMDLLTVAPLHHPLRWDEIVGAVSPDDLLLSGATDKNGLLEMVSVIRNRLSVRTTLFKHGKLSQTIKDKIVIVVTEGCRTGLKLAPSLQLLSRQQPAKIIVAAPVIAPEACRRLKVHAGDVHSLSAPLPYVSTRAFYKDFPIFNDEDLATIFLS